MSEQTFNTEDTGDQLNPAVGSSDADADAARAGADGGDADYAHETWQQEAGSLDEDSTRDDDGVAVGRSDADADAMRAGVDPDRT
jgi:hypothetical protein